MSMSKHEAAVLLGMADSEVVSVDDSDAGPVVSTFDGQSYVVVDGKVMFLTSPTKTYGGSFPVYLGPDVAAPAKFVEASKAANRTDDVVPLDEAPSDDDEAKDEGEDGDADGKAAHATEPVAHKTRRAANR